MQTLDLGEVFEEDSVEKVLLAGLLLLQHDTTWRPYYYHAPPEQWETKRNGYQDCLALVRALGLTQGRPHGQWKEIGVILGLLWRGDSTADLSNLI